MDNRILIAGAVILGIGIMGAVLMESGAEEVGGVMMAPMALTILNPLFWIILAIVAFSRRRGQQQQQVVVVTGGQAAHTDGPRLRCPDCHGLSRADARFCGGCGMAFG